MDATRKAKLLELRQKKNANRDKTENQRHTEFLQSVKSLHDLFVEKNAKDVEKTDQLLEKLGEFSSFKSEVAEVRRAIEALPKVDKVAISNISELIDGQKKLDLTEVTNSITKLSQSIEDAKNDAVNVTNRKVEDFIPVRRVRLNKLGKLEFDDEPMQVTVVGGGGGIASGAGGGGARGYVVLSYNKYHKPSALQAIMIGVGVFARKLEMFRFFQTSMTGLASTQRYVRTIAKVATAIGLATTARYVRLKDKVATMTGVASTVRYIRLSAKVATMIGVAGFSRTLEIFRTFTATMTGVPTMSKALILVRYFGATMTGVAKTAIQMPQTALNRIVGGGGTTIVKKVINYIFDD